MKFETRILAGTAIGLFMAGGTLSAAHATTRADLLENADLVVVAQAEEPGNGQPADEPAEAEKAPELPKPEQQEPAAESPAAEPAREKATPQAEAVDEAKPPKADDEPSAAEPAKKRPTSDESKPAALPSAEEKPARQPEPTPQEAPAPEDAPDEPTPEKAPEPSPAPAQPTPEVAPEPEPTPEKQPEKETPEKAPEPSAAPAEPTREVAPQPTPSPDGAQQEATPEQAPDRTQSPDAPAEGEQPAQAEQPASKPTGSGPGGNAPVLDSQKHPSANEGTTPAPAAPVAPSETEQPAETLAPTQQIEPSSPPKDDGSAQREVRPAELQPVTAEKGRRIERRPQDPIRERPEGAEVVREIGDRVLIEVNNQVIVESNDRPRIARDARDVYYEELPRGRTREVIVRGDGSRVVTIRNRYGDVVRRSRIAPDEREYVLVYVEDADFDRVGEWRDPGLDLPPLRLTIPEDEYILEAEEVRDPDIYYTFLEQPPVERVERLYSIDEVKRSARIRDKTRRVDLDTITFEFGSAAVPESEIPRLEGVAKAMEKLLARNPAETFLIEGHTDAVGSDMANLALSDRRAEAVAEALTNVFAIPPENLSTQGYGEQYLKVKTQEPKRQNRRVGIRRITPLVAPVASAR